QVDLRESVEARAPAAAKDAAPEPGDASQADVDSASHAGAGLRSSEPDGAEAETVAQAPAASAWAAPHDTAQEPFPPEPEDAESLYPDELASLSETSGLADARAVLENGIRGISGEVRNSLDFHRTQEGGA